MRLPRGFSIEKSKPNIDKARQASQVLSLNKLPMNAVIHSSPDKDGSPSGHSVDLNGGGPPSSLRAAE